jgi:hypothetical protein
MAASVISYYKPELPELATIATSKNAFLEVACKAYYMHMDPTDITACC